MKVKEVLTILSQIDADYDVAIEQIFKERKSMDLRSIEIIDKCVFLRDHYVRISEHSAFIAFDGNQFSVPVVSQRRVQL